MYGSALLVRGILIIRNKIILRGTHAHLSVLGSNLLEVRIPNSGLKWKAGQHFFFRFTGLNFFDSLQSHPFTACTVPSSSGGKGAAGDLIALAKIRRGLILDLANHAFWQNGLRVDVWVDGPYGAPLKTLPAYERILLLGGGSGECICTSDKAASILSNPSLDTGLSFITSTANELVHQHGRTDFHVVTVCRDGNQLQAYLDLLPSESDHRLSTYSTGVPVLSDSATQPLLPSVEEIDEEKQEKRSAPAGGCCSSRAIATTAHSEPEISPARANSPSSDDAYETEKTMPPKTIAVKDVKAARPDLKSIIAEEASQAHGSRLAIVACGPDSFMRDVQDSVAALQWDILKGRSKVNEVYLRSEAFHW